MSKIAYTFQVYTSAASINIAYALVLVKRIKIKNNIYSICTSNGPGFIKKFINDLAKTGGFAPGLLEDTFSIIFEDSKHVCKRSWIGSTP